MLNHKLIKNNLGSSRIGIYLIFIFKNRNFYTKYIKTVIKKIKIYYIFLKTFFKSKTKIFFFLKF